MKKKLFFLLAAIGGFFAVKKSKAKSADDADLWNEATKAPDLP